MEYATIIAIVVIGIVIALVVYFRKPEVHTPQAIKDLEDRLRERIKGIEDRQHQTALATPPPPVVPELTYEQWVDGFGPKNGAPLWVITRWNTEHTLTGPK